MLLGVRRRCKDNFEESVVGRRFFLVAFSNGFVIIRDSATPKVTKGDAAMTNVVASVGRLKI
jgi:hypothetical protein